MKSDVEILVFSGTSIVSEVKIQISFDIHETHMTGIFDFQINFFNHFNIRNNRSAMLNLKMPS